MKYKGYRKAKLSIEPVQSEDLKSSFGVGRGEIHQPHLYDTNRGTITHAAYSGVDAVPFINGGFINLRIACPNPTDQSLDDPVRFAVAVSVEVAEQSQIDVYEEIKIGIQDLIRTRERSLIR